MELLPNSVEDFTSSEYWSNFFRSYGGENNRAFEWYGDFEVLRDLLVESLRTSGRSELYKRILHVGCGNSTLPAKLYDEGFKDITNIDFSSQVIDLMREKNKSKKGLEWICMDIEKDFGKYVDKEENLGNFDVIIDKGFLDAYLSDNTSKNSSSSKTKASDYLASSMRLLVPNGRYILVTLGQEYVAKALTMEFYNKGLDIIVEPLVEIKDSKFLPYYIEIINKKDTQSTNKTFFRFKGAGVDEIYTSEDQCIWTLAKRLKELSAMYWNNKYIGDFMPGEIKEYQLNIKESRNSFFITVYDTISKKKNKQLTVGLLVPIGEEQDWLYSTRKGFEEICNQAKCKRLIVISRLYSDSEKALKVSKEDILDEISKNISPLALKGSGRFPILTVGGDRNLNKKCIYSCDSKFCKQILVYDIEESGIEKRQMIFKSSPRLIQSEVVIQRKSPERLEFDYLSGLSNYYVGVVLVSSLILDTKNQDKKKNALILGLGGGILASILRKFYSKSILNISAIEIDQKVMNIAKDYFGFSENDVEVIITDALDYIDNSHSKIQDSLDYIIVDINSGSVNDSLMCPGVEFLSKGFVEKLILSLTNDGCIIYNISCRDTKRKEELFNEFGNMISAIEERTGNSKGLLLQSVETGEDEINELWIIKKETKDNIKKVRNFIIEKQLFISNQEGTSSEKCGKKDLWVKRFSNLK
ncbi:SAM dependent methyltransferase [Cryptosporidium ubiquitum]|uniref:SAM dependent methyltransferase n=1 Tax=Cryptosporidium ubiquitum TaxID=857276 RepID=A0A1J4MFZ4_9CRYT|nr:SAM dependent methyltransferase [Cryptosporidium ubiquitum]OII73178.1 SAM dependent methyltransferase [Cryptosporidium ubiquitum]